MRAMTRRLGAGCTLAVLAAWASSAWAQQPAYVRSTVAAPWGSNTNEQAMDLAFGAGGWDDLRYETVDPAVLFSGAYRFVYLEGSDSSADELETFLTANIALAEAWTAGGNGLFMNAAPNEGNGMSFGFGGIALTYPDFSVNPGSAIDPAHPIWAGPNLPTPLSFTGTAFAHASVGGNPSLTGLIQDADGGSPQLAELDWGCGGVLVGGLTTTNFWTPAADSLNLRANMIAYMASYATGAANEACPGRRIEVSSLTIGSGATVTVAGDTTCAANQIAEGSAVTCWGGSEAAEHVYTFTLAADTGLQIDTVGSGYDTKLGVVSGCPDGAAFCRYNDDYVNLDSGFDCETYSAGTYSVIVSGFAGNIGPYLLNLTECDPAGFCGDGNVTAGEDCDDLGESALCDADCTFATCGDGTTNATAGEECDDLGESATCDDDCTAATCGDGNTNNTAGETCDDAGESATCDDDCTGVTCGDGNANTTAGETCDDGGESATCDDDCTAPSCGDANVNQAAGEECDAGGETAACNANCTNASCGDGVVNTTAGEACDDAGESVDCNVDCSVSACGDGVTNVTAGEDCDDSGESMNCNDDCTDAVCGDSKVNPTAGETCDTGGATATCDADCTAPLCGDGVVNAAAGEACDDAGESADCNADCSVAACGDEVVNVAAGEECDDGNLNPADGCGPTCLDETSGSGGGGGDATGGGGGDATGGSGGGGAGGEGTGGAGADDVADDGCACTTPGAPSSSSRSRWAVAFALLGAAVAAQRRRPRR